MICLPVPFIVVPIGAGLAGLEQIGDGQDLAAARAASAVADAPGEQVAVGAAAFAGEPVAAAGALVDAGGGAAPAWRQLRRAGAGGGCAAPVGGLPAGRGAVPAGPSGGQRGAAVPAGWRNAGVTRRAVGGVRH